METAELKYSDQEFLEIVEFLRKTDRIKYLAVMCVLVRNNEAPAVEAFLGRTSKGDLKRVVRIMRCVQGNLAKGSGVFELIEDTIAYIRRRWITK